jgi:cbb3-type cytochrome c oxidase subunit III
MIQWSVLAGAALICFSISLSPASTAQPLPQDKKSAQDAGTRYAKNCATCHGKDGAAKTFKSKFKHAQDLTDAKWQESTTDEHVFNSIQNGRGKMPAFGKKFSEAEINALVAYVRKFKR